jgi:CheY-like chemotaxis protein
MENDVIIVISEDDRGHFILIKHALRHAGIGNELVWLSDGQQTLDYIYSADGGIKLQDDKRYILLLDIRMPKIDGIDILEELRRDSRLKDMPILMVTSSDNPDNVRMCRDRGCDGYIVKPLDDRAIDLIRMLGSAIPRNQHSG